MRLYNLYVYVFVCICMYVLVSFVSVCIRVTRLRILAARWPMEARHGLGQQRSSPARPGTASILLARGDWGVCLVCPKPRRRAAQWPDAWVVLKSRISVPQREHEADAHPVQARHPRAHPGRRQGCQLYRDARRLPALNLLLPLLVWRHQGAFAERSLRRSTVHARRNQVQLHGRSRIQRIQHGRGVRVGTAACWKGRLSCPYLLEQRRHSAYQEASRTSHHMWVIMIHEYPKYAVYLFCIDLYKHVTASVCMYMYILCLYLYVFAGIGMYYSNMSEKWLSTKARIALYLHVLICIDMYWYVLICIDMYPIVLVCIIIECPSQCEIGNSLLI